MDLAWLKEQAPCFDVSIYLKGPEKYMEKESKRDYSGLLGWMKLHDLVLITIQEISRSLYFCFLFGKTGRHIFNDKLHTPHFLSLCTSIQSKYSSSMLGKMTYSGNTNILYFDRSLDLLDRSLL